MELDREDRFDLYPMIALLAMLLLMLALGAGLWLRVPVGGAVSALLPFVVGVLFASMGCAQAMRRHARRWGGPGPVLRGLDAAASTPAYGLAVALGLGLMLMPQDRLVQALVGLPGLVGLGLGAGALLSRPAPSAKP